MHQCGLAKNLLFLTRAMIAMMNVFAAPDIAKKVQPG